MSNYHFHLYFFKNHGYIIFHTLIFEKFKFDLYYTLNYNKLLGYNLGCYNFCGSFGKPNNGTICMSLFYMYFLHRYLVYSSTLSFPRFLSSQNLMRLITNNWLNLSR